MNVVWFLLNQRLRQALTSSPFLPWSYNVYGVTVLALVRLDKSILRSLLTESSKARGSTFSNLLPPSPWSICGLLHQFSLSLRLPPSRLE